MWLPRDVDDIEAVVAAGSLAETASFDVKEALPPRGKNGDLAVDIAAMSTEGGTLLYGVAEDDDGRPTRRMPIELAGARERIAHVAATAIREPPRIDIYEHPLRAEPSRGYLVVHVPRSARAPHQVISGRNFRYYGRGPAGNRPLTEGEVASLYERRERWSVSASVVLDGIIEAAPFGRPPSHLAFVHAFAKPVAADQSFVDKAAPSHDVADLLRELRDDAAAGVQRAHYAPDIAQAYSVIRRGADSWLLHDGLQHTEDPKPSNVVAMELFRDGTLTLFCGRAADTINSHKVLFEPLIAGNTAVVFATAGRLAERADYHGDFDVGVCVRGIGGAVSYRVYRRGFWSGTGFGNDEFRRIARVASKQLRDEPREVALDLLRHLLEVTLPPGSDVFIDS